MTSSSTLANAGDPVRLFHHLGLGVWSFLAHPAVGLVDSARGRGPLRFVVGLQEGFSSLVGNFVFAISNATAKASAAMRQVMPVDAALLIGPGLQVQPLHFKPSGSPSPASIADLGDIA